MKILVTGGAGYIGSILTEQLLKNGNTVHVVDNFMYHQWSLAHLVHHPNLHIHKIDIRNEAAIRPLIKLADIIIPLAGIVGAPACQRDPHLAYSINQEAQIRLLNMLGNTQWVLMPTTNSAYGTTPKGKITTEMDELNPLSDYAKQKVEVEKVLMARTNSISFRLATAFGISPRMRLDLLVNDFTYRAVTDQYLVIFEGHFRRNFIHIRDIANVFLHGIRNFENMHGEIYNVGLSTANITKLELCALIKEIVPNFYYTEAPLKVDPDKRDYEVSNAKIESTGWRPAIGLETGIRELVRGFSMINKSNQMTNI